MFEFLANSAIKLLGYLVPASVRWYYTPQRLADSVRVRLQSEGDGVEIWNGDLPNVRLWLVFTNLSPFPLELERAEARVSFGNPIANAFNLNRWVIPPASEVSVLFETRLNSFELEYVKKMRAMTNRLDILVSTFMLTKINNFEVRRTIPTTHIRFVNFN